jgi:hypothetical protein
MTNPTLQDVRNRRAEIAKITADLKVEDAELATAEKVLIRLGATAPLPLMPVVIAEPEAAPVSVSMPPASQEAESEGLVSDVVKNIMTGHESLEQLIALMFENCSDEWWTANEVQICLTEIKGKEVPMSSISPTLTNMKNNGVIVRDGFNVGLAARHKQMETATNDGGR